MFSAKEENFEFSAKKQNWGGPYFFYILRYKKSKAIGKIQKIKEEKRRMAETYILDTPVLVSAKVTYFKELLEVINFITSLKRSTPYLSILSKVGKGNRSVLFSYSKDALSKKGDKDSDEISNCITSFSTLVKITSLQFPSYFLPSDGSYCCSFVSGKNTLLLNEFNLFVQFRNKAEISKIPLFDLLKGIFVFCNETKEILSLVRTTGASYLPILLTEASNLKKGGKLALDLLFKNMNEEEIIKTLLFRLKLGKPFPAALGLENCPFGKSIYYFYRSYPGGQLVAFYKKEENSFLITPPIFVLSSLNEKPNLKYYDFKPLNGKISLINGFLPSIDKIGFHKDIEKERYLTSFRKVEISLKEKRRG